jgi:hypothetical protein
MRISRACLLIVAVVALSSCRLKGKLKRGADAGAASLAPTATGAPAGGSPGKSVRVADLFHIPEGEDPRGAEEEAEEPAEVEDARGPVAVIKDAGATKVTVVDAGKSTGPSDAGVPKPDAGKPKATGNTKALLVSAKGGACPSGYVKRSGDPMCHLSCPPECPTGAKCTNLICTAAQ